ncbi:MAG: putative toxin-antitoxin system toxin component, PIN family [Anaerolineales bacterium]
MKIVIDTNVLVSAILKDKVPEDVLLFIIDTPEFEWVASPEILAEYKEVLSRKKLHLSKELVTESFELLDESILIIPISLEIDFPRDRKDAKFIACALNTDADYLITGDKDFVEAEKMMSTTILSVKMFRKAVMESWGR